MGKLALLSKEINEMYYGIDETEVEQEEQKKPWFVKINIIFKK